MSTENEIIDAAMRQMQRVTQGARSFAEEMRSKGIHVGLGAHPRCVTCGTDWPCAASAATPEDPNDD